MRFRDILPSLLVMFSVISPVAGWCWGPDGHAIIGRSAFSLANPAARSEVREILAPGPGKSIDEAMDHACNWPDQVRETGEWEWTAPLHYVNIPRSSRHYDRQRDCPDGRCVTEAIVKYANELSHPEKNPERRWQAFAFLCHFAGDLHQPLHAGFKDDRGANRIEVRFRARELNLHQFWDSALPDAFMGEGGQWERPLSGRRWGRAGSFWNPADVMSWTDESHALAALYAYPHGRDISENFARRGWLITREQWQIAAQRLATILNAVLGEGEVLSGE